VATLSHHIEYLALKSVTFVVNLLPARIVDACGAGLGRLGHRLLKSRREIARDNLRQALGHRLSDTEIEDVVRRVFRNIGRTTLEILRFYSLDRGSVRKIVSGDCEDMLADLYAKGKAGLVTTAHFGNWELLGMWVASLGYPMGFIVGEQHNKKVDDLFNSLRASMGVDIISARRSLRGAGKRFTTKVTDFSARYSI